MPKWWCAKIKAVPGPASMLARRRNARDVLGVFRHALLVAGLALAAAQDDVMTADGLNLTDYDADRVGLCGTGMTTDANNTACVCVEGYGFVNDACSECAVGTYKDFAGNASCSACPAHSTSLLGSASATECLCAAGFAFNGSACVECGIGTYKAYAANEACLACEALRTTDAVGSTAASDCVCVAGYQDNAGVCEPCAVGTHDDGNNVCVSCGAGESTLSTGSASAAECVCAVGFGWHVFDDREACPAGWTAAECLYGGYLPPGVAQGEAHCALCPSGTFKNWVGSEECAAVPANTVQALEVGGGYTTWECAKGFTLVGSACEPCAAHTYKDTAGNGTCADCWANSHGAYAVQCSSLTSFNRAELDKINLGPIAWNIADNGGFTAVMKVKFEGDPADGQWNRLFEFGKLDAANTIWTISLLQYSTNNDLNLNMNYNVDNSGLVTCRNANYDYTGGSQTTPITYGTWHTIVARYRNSNKEAFVSVDGVARTKTCSDTNFPNYVASENWIGGHWSSNAARHFNGKIAGLFAFDRYLDDAQVAAVAAGISTDATEVQDHSTACYGNAGSEWCACDPGFYASASGVCAACTADHYCVGGTSYDLDTGDHGARTACPANSTAPVGVSSEEECVCVGGFEKIE